MTDIERILTTGETARIDDQVVPTEGELQDIEAALGFRFPESYREFLRLNRLSELRIRHRVLPPSEVLHSRHYLPDLEHIPFADNGCGDLYYWPRSEMAEPPVVVADHETSAYNRAAESFTHSG